jgi:hypothetical protein
MRFLKLLSDNLVKGIAKMKGNRVEQKQDKVIYDRYQQSGNDMILGESRVLARLL